MNEDNPLTNAPQAGSEAPQAATIDNGVTHAGTAGMTNVEHSKKGLVFALIAVLLLAGGGFAAYKLLNTKKPAPAAPDKPVVTESTFDSANFLKKAYAKTEGNKNIVVSPYSMESVWRLAIGGAQGETKDELLSVFGDRTMPTFSQLKIANGLFIRDSFTSYMKPDFVNSFVGDLKYDSFATPDFINNWANEKTDGMIPAVLDEAPDPTTVLILANAILMEEGWDDGFMCYATKEADFTKANGDISKAAMMAGEANKYFKTENAEGVIRDYAAHEDGSKFEFIGILPDGDIKTYLDQFSEDEIASIDGSTIENGTHNDDDSINVVRVNLPRFSYDYDLPEAIAVMKELGISKVFEDGVADFGAMIDTDKLRADGMSFYISKVTQKARIELDENGTKAAAVSTIGGDVSSAIVENDYVYYTVEFNRPFVFLIRDKETKEVIFEGVVEEPEAWSGSTCSE